MKFGEVYTYKNAEEAKQYIGKKGVFSDNLRVISDMAELCDVFILREIGEGCTYPFAGEDEEDAFQFFRPILEDEPLMTNRQLAEWLARGKGEYTLEKSLGTYSHYDYPRTKEHGSVPDNILIRRWKDTNWMKPTMAIYEEDCK